MRLAMLPEDGCFQGRRIDTLATGRLLSPPRRGSASKKQQGCCFLYTCPFNFADKLHILANFVRASLAISCGVQPSRVSKHQGIAKGKE